MLVTRSSTKANTHCDKLVTVVGYAMADVRPSTDYVGLLITLTLCIQYDVREAVRQTIYLQQLILSCFDLTCMLEEDWKSSVFLPIYKGKGDPMECGSYRGIKLLEHGLKVVERIFEHRIRQQVEIDDIQFGFMKGKGTTDAICIVRQMQENFRVEGKKLYFVFLDLEKLLIGFQKR